MIATDAAISVALGIVKVSVFGIAGVITPKIVAFALLIGIISVPGAFIAKRLVERMTVRVHTAILDAVIIVGGCFLLECDLALAFGADRCQPYSAAKAGCAVTHVDNSLCIVGEHDDTHLVAQLYRPLRFARTCARPG